MSRSVENETDLCNDNSNDDRDDNVDDFDEVARRQVSFWLIMSGLLLHKLHFTALLYSRSSGCSRHNSDFSDIFRQLEYTNCF